MRGWVIGLACVALAGGCEERAGPAPVSQAGASGVASGSGVDWSAVTAASDGSQIVAHKALARMCDGWHRGSLERIVLRYGADGQIRDEAGNACTVAREDWKGIVEDARRGLPDGSRLLTVAAKSRMYSDPASGFPQDTFGTIAQYRYHIEVVDPDSLCFINAGKHDDGR